MSPDTPIIVHHNESYLLTDLNCTCEVTYQTDIKVGFQTRGKSNSLALSLQALSEQHMEENHKLLWQNLYCDGVMSLNKKSTMTVSMLRPIWAPPTFCKTICLFCKMNMVLVYFAK